MVGLRGSFSAGALALALVGGTARADDAATADALFQAGRSAMQQQDYAQAAARFAESQRLEPAPGTLLNLAIAEEKLGRLSAAWEHARSVATELPPSDDRRAIAHRLYEALNARVPRIVLEGANLPDGARVTLDGLALTRSSFGVPLPVDPGQRRVVVDAPGYAPRAFELSVSEGATSRVDLTLEAPLNTRLPVDEPPPRKAGTALRTAGWVSLGVGAAAVAVGSVFGVLAIDRNRIVEAQCDGDVCTERGAAASRDGSTFAATSTAVFIGAGALVVSGVLLLLLAPKASSAATASPLRATAPLRLTW